jgi:hypothetical protein
MTTPSAPTKTICQMCQLYEGHPYDTPAVDMIQEALLCGGRPYKLLSEYAMDNVFGQAKQREANLIARYKAAQAEVKETREEMGRFDDRVQEEVEPMRKVLEETRKELYEANTKVRDQVLVNRAQKTYIRLIKGTRIDRAVYREELNDTKKQLSDTREELGKANKELEETRKELEDTRKQLELLRLSSGA